MQHNSAQSDGVFEFRRHNFTNNPVRFVDAFVDALSLVALGFKIQTLKAVVQVSIPKYFLKYICMDI
jgi:hypothetical protein